MLLLLLILSESHPATWLQQLVCQMNAKQSADDLRGAIIKQSHLQYLLSTMVSQQPLSLKKNSTNMQNLVGKKLGLL